MSPDPSFVTSRSIPALILVPLISWRLRNEQCTVGAWCVCVCMYVCIYIYMYKVL